MLFYLPDDLSEKTDLASKYPEKVRALKALYATWDAEMDADCRAFGIAPPRAKGSAAAERAFVASETFSGFDQLDHVFARQTPVGVQVASDRDGQMMKKLPQPVVGRAVFTLDITPGTGSPSNGFFAFGKGASSDLSIKCGLLVGGDRIAIYQGLFGSKESAASVPLTGGKTYSVTVEIDTAAREVMMRVAGNTLRHPLPAGLDEIGYVGYGLVRTQSRFGSISQTVGR
jgi:hypothetical protein